MNEERPRSRAYDSTLRARQAEQTRDLILETAAHILAEQGIQALSVAEIARQAGVSLRTVWRNFASLDEVIDEVDRKSAIGGPDLHPALDALQDHVRVLYDFFDGHPDLLLATLYWRFAQGQAPPARVERAEQMMELLKDATPHLSPELQRAGAAALTLLPNGMAWATLRKELGWTAAESGPAVGWILQLVIDELVRLGAGGEPRVRPAQLESAGDQLHGKGGGSV